MEIVFSGLFGAIVGAVITGVLGLALDLVRRRQRQTEILVALHAEIVASLSKVKEQNAPNEVAYALGDSTPFAMPDESDFVFESLKSDPCVLPQSVIYEVIRYYRLAAQSNGMVSGLTEETFRKEQTPEAKRKYISNLMDVLKEQELAGLQALDAIEIEAGRRGDDLGTALPLRRREAGIAQLQRSKPMV